LQGGGFANGFNGIGSFTVSPGEPQPVELDGWSFPSGEDHGAQYFSANPTSRNGVALVMSRQSKTRHPDGTVNYGFAVESTDVHQEVTFDVQGGGFVNGFNGVGHATINPRDSIPFTATFGNGEDRGAQYFSANVTDRAGSRVVISEQRKGWDLQGGAFYGFTVTNEDPDFPAICDFQGGGFI
jgi:hypothetical protein